MLVNLGDQEFELLFDLPLLELIVVDLSLSFGQLGLDLGELQIGRLDLEIQRGLLLFELVECDSRKP